jgi:cytohesin
MIVSPLSAAIAGAGAGVGGSLESLKLLIAAGADVNGNAYEKSPLAFSIAHCNIASAKLLLDAKADVNAPCHSVELSPLIGAVCLGNVEMTKFLISVGADLTVRNGENLSVLEILVTSCDADGRWVRARMEGDTYFSDQCNNFPCDYKGVFKALIDAKVDVSVRGPSGVTPLLAAVDVQNVEAVDALLAAGADPNTIAKDGQSVLRIASYIGCFGAASALIDAGADVNSMTTKGSTPLSTAVSNNYIDIVSALIANGADVNYFSSNPDYTFSDETVLDIAIEHEHKEIVDMLTEAGAHTWREMIAMDKRIFIVKRSDLVVGRRRFNVDLIGSGNNTHIENALKLAVVIGELELVKYLLAVGVNPSLTYRGGSILCLACDMGYTDIAKVLVDAGADIAFKCSDGMTAMMCAAKGKHRNIVALLLVKAKELKKANK